MTTAGLPVEERLRQLLQHLGIDQAHFAGRLPRDWTGLATTSPEVFTSLSLVAPTALDPQTVGSLEGSAEALPCPDNSVDVTMSVTVIEEVNANQMLAEMVRVTKPGGRVAVVARAMDIPFLMHLRLRAEVRAKVEAPGAIGNVAEQGCADASLYQRLHQAGLTQVKMFPQLAAFHSADPTVLQFMQDALLPKLSQEEAREWQRARAQAEAEGTFFMSWPHHCAVGTKP